MNAPILRKISIHISPKINGYYIDGIKQFEVINEKNHGECGYMINQGIN